jgi:hypothetical protein
VDPVTQRYTAPPNGAVLVAVEDMLDESVGALMADTAPGAAMPDEPASPPMQDTPAGTNVYLPLIMR